MVRPSTVGGGVAPVTLRQQQFNPRPSLQQWHSTASSKAADPKEPRLAWECDGQKRTPQLASRGPSTPRKTRLSLALAFLAPGHTLAHMLSLSLSLLAFRLLAHELQRLPLPASLPPVRPPQQPCRDSAQQEESARAAGRAQDCCA